MTNTTNRFDDEQLAFCELRDIIAERTNGVVAWVGAGLSVACGLPTWRQLRDCLCDELLAKANRMEEPSRAKYRSQYQLAFAEDDLWLAIQILKDALGETTYRELIRSRLSRADRATVPLSYKQLWQLKLSGMFTLNLDRLAARAFSEVSPGTKSFEFSGKRAGVSVHLLRSPYPFIANLHGTTEGFDEWVFTRDELRTLLQNHGYLQFINSCCTTRTLLFVGISADDVAAGGHLQRLTTLGLDFGAHFWLTDRADGRTNAWAEKFGVRTILYSNPDGQHLQLGEALQLLHDYEPAEREAVPVTPHSTTTAAARLADPATLESMDAESIREILNARAVQILSSSSSRHYDEYFAFLEQYSEAVYRAWFLTTTPPKNTLLGYTLIDKLSSGAFGTVYLAHTPDGDTVAIKVLHERIRSDPQMLQGFRRGVASMEILAKHHINGVVTYRQASEIPAFVVMEYVAGPSLDDAVEAQRLPMWGRVLSIGVDLVRIIRASHQLTERVLHRDIRPSNIMLRNGWDADPDTWEVVVLDFDLSWHRDAREVSVVHPNSINGYLAPEQSSRGGESSTRNALVDSYGIGLTLFFLRTGTHPQFLEPQHADWQHTLRSAASRFPCSSWKSAPRRFFRLVSNAARHRQSERWDASQILGELERLQAAVNRPLSVVSAELLVEELAARAFPHDYNWDADSLSAKLELPTGLAVTLIADEVNRRILLDASWLQTGSAHYQKIHKWLPAAKDAARATLANAGWRVDAVQGDVASFKVAANISSDDVHNRLEDCAISIAKVLEHISFS